MIELHIIQPDRRIIKAQLQEGLYYAGSSSAECQLLLKFPGVSRKHLEMRVKASSLYIKDLDSANGTLLNGTPIPKDKYVKLNANDKISIGTANLVIS
jgi:pSer/pThr/pTyr-binding forkhead associated (FHA) protein